MKESGKQKLELLRRRFGEWLAACNYAVRTREEYERSVRDFIEWLAKETEIEGINEALPQHLHQYQMALCQRPAEDFRSARRPSGWLRSRPGSSGWRASNCWPSIRPRRCRCRKSRVACRATC